MFARDAEHGSSISASALVEVRRTSAEDVVERRETSRTTVPENAFAPPPSLPGTVDAARGVKPLSGPENISLRELKSGVAPGDPSPSEDSGIEL